MDSSTSCLYCNGKTERIWGTKEFVKCRTCELIKRRSTFLNNELDALYVNSWENPLAEVSETGTTDSDLAQLRSRLVPGVWLYITTPNADSLNAKLNGAKRREAKRRGHLWLFRPKSLEKMLINTGYSHVHRVHWNITYIKKLAVRIKDSLLLRFHMNGELRFIATMPVSR